MLKFTLIFLIGCSVEFSLAKEEVVDYTGHKVIAVIPRQESDVHLIRQLRDKYNVDLWNERAGFNASVLMRLTPSQYKTILPKLSKRKIEHDVTIHNLQSVIDEERKVRLAPIFPVQNASFFDFSRYNTLEQIEALLKDLTSRHSDIAKLETVGQSYENRPIYAVRITSGNQFGSKPAILIECGIHAREWTSVASGSYMVNQLITKYGSDQEITNLVNKYEFYIIPEANPDGYVYSYTNDRMWRKTRSVSRNDWTGNCRGADANRNFDIEHCGVGTSMRPCDDIYCGDAPFSENESRTLRDLMKTIGSRMKAYFTVHAFSQLWMTPYGINKGLPPDYQELVRVGTAGASALSQKYGTRFRVGSIANIIYEAAGSSVDYAYLRNGIKMSFALELRDTGTYGFFLPQYQILPACEETLDGLMGAITALR